MHGIVIPSTFSWICQLVSLANNTDVSETLNVSFLNDLLRFIHSLAVLGAYPNLSKTLNYRKYEKDVFLRRASK